MAKVRVVGVGRLRSGKVIRRSFARLIDIRGNLSDVPRLSERQTIAQAWLDAGEDLRKAMNESDIEIDALDLPHDALVQTR